MKSARPLLSARVRCAAPRLRRGKARLFPDRLELAGWTGRTQASIPLAEIAELHWWMGAPDVNLELRLHDGRTVGLHLKGAGLWKYEIEAHAPNLAPVPAQDPDTPPRRMAKPAA